MQRATKGTAVSRPPARHQKLSRQSPARPDPYDRGPYDDSRYDRSPYDDSPYDRGVSDYRPYDSNPYGGGISNYRPYDPNYRLYDRGPFEPPVCDEAHHHDAPYDEAPYDDTPYDDTPYDDTPYDDTPYDDTPYDDTPCDDTPCDDTPCDDTPCDDTPCDDTPCDEDLYDTPYDRGVPGRRPPGRPGAHARHKRPSRMRRKPVRIAAAVAGSTLLVSAAVPVAAHSWHRPATHPTALDQESPPGTGGAAFGAGAQIPSQPAAPENALDQWSQIPVGKHAAQAAA
jgi:hypothetical protein